MRARTTAYDNKTNVRAEAAVDSQVYKVGMTTIGMAACAIGLWSFAALIGGMVSSGGPIALVGDWFRAAFGM